MKNTNNPVGAAILVGSPVTKENSEVSSIESNGNFGRTVGDAVSETKTWRACLYLRISKEDGDKEESESVTNQRALLLAHAAKLSDMTVVAEKIDDGWSGANFQRPAFMEMIEEIKAGAIDCVLVKDLTRFGRNFGESGKYIEHIFPFLGVRFISVNDSIDSLNKKNRSDDIVVPFLNLISDAYCRDISVKIRSQLDTKRKKGDFIGAFAVFGYKRDDRNHNRLVIDTPAADIVRLIFQWKLDGQSAEAIANKLNNLGILSPMAYKKSQGMNFSTSFAVSPNTKWSAVAVFRILKDETYTGVMIQGKVSTPNHKIKKKFQKPVSDWARVDGMHEPIICPQDFSLAARLLERDTRTAPGSESVYPFSGMARCGLCGENMIRKTIRTGGKAYVYFVCCHNCKGARITEGLLTDCFTAALQSHISNIMSLDRILRFIDDLPLKQDEVQKLDGQIVTKRTDMERYKSLVFSLYESFQSGIISEESYRQMHTHYTTLRDEAEQAINSLTREIGEIINTGGEKNRWIERFREYQDFAEVTRRMVVSLLDMITVYPGNKLDILFRYRYDYERCASFVKAVEQLHTLPAMPAADHENKREAV